jgi:DNA-binding transcriptional ArsR family regulator
MKQVIMMVLLPPIVPRSRRRWFARARSIRAGDRLCAGAMSTIASLSAIATLIGEPARTAMLVTLMDGRALTAGELAGAAGIGRPAASAHLVRLHEAGLLALEAQGRHRYYRLAGPAVAAMLEGMMALDASLAGAVPRKPVRTGPRDRDLRRARLCYDHLAGEVAVAIADAMTARAELDFARGGAILTERGLALLTSLGVEPGPSAGSATFCRPCLDWSERRPHIAGAVGAALLRTFVDRHWMRPAATGRAVTITPPGLAALDRYFGVTPGLSEAAPSASG